MPIRNVQFANGEFYHIIKRGVEQRKIFLDDEDRIRFINSLFIFNNEKPTEWNDRSFWYKKDPSSLISKESKPESSLVEVHAFVLMDNHFHILVKQIRENGISNFMSKLGGYSYYFNKKYQRVGPLFQGRFKAVLVRTDDQLKNVFVYVHTNPIGLIKPGWKESGIEDFHKANHFLTEYQWSSYPDYLGRERFSVMLKTDFFMEIFSGIEGCRQEVEYWLEHKFDMGKFVDVALE